MKAALFSPFIYISMTTIVIGTMGLQWNESLLYGYMFIGFVNLSAKWLVVRKIFPVTMKNWWKSIIWWPVELYRIANDFRAY